MYDGFRPRRPAPPPKEGWMAVCTVERCTCALAADVGEVVGAAAAAASMAAL